MRETACQYEAGRAVVAVAMRGAEAVEWTAVLPSRKLRGDPTCHARNRHGVTKLALATIASPQHHPLLALDDAVIALAGSRAIWKRFRTSRAYVAKSDRAIFDAVWATFCGYTQRESVAFEHWIAVRADFILHVHRAAVESIAAKLDAQNEVAGREIAAEVAAARVGIGL